MNLDFAVFKNVFSSSSIPRIYIMYRFVKLEYEWDDLLKDFSGIEILFIILSYLLVYLTTFLLINSIVILSIQ